MKIYGISGLGADKRVFKFLNLNAEFIPIDWIEPLKNESIIDYSKRLSTKIDTKDKFCILGVSFGGLIATEISKILKPSLTVLISSAETKNELLLIYRLFGKTKLIKLIPEKIFNPPKKIAHYLFGTKQTKLLNAILDDTNLRFAKWAVSKLVSWKNEEKLENVLRINGTKDKLIPSKKGLNVKLIEGGEHFMIVDRAKEISDLINEKLKKLK